MSTWSTFLESWPLFADSVLAGSIAGATLGLLGVYVVVRRMVFLSAALSQTAGLGVTLAFWAPMALGLPASFASPTFGAAAVSLVVVLWLMSDVETDASRRDAHLGVVFLVGAAGTLAVGTRIVQELPDVQSLLFGTAVAVVPEDLSSLAVCCAAVLALHVWWRRGFEAIATDAVDAQVRGLPVRVLEFASLASVAVVIAVTTRILGALPAFAFSVLPAMAALRIAPNVTIALIVAASIGAGCGFGGYYVAFAYDLPVGAAQTGVGVLAFMVMAFVGRWKR